MGHHRRRLVHFLFSSPARARIRIGGTLRLLVLNLRRFLRSRSEYPTWHSFFHCSTSTQYWIYVLLFLLVVIISIFEKRKLFEKTQNHKSRRQLATAVHRGETWNLMVTMMMESVAMDTPPSLATRQRHRQRRMPISPDVQWDADAALLFLLAALLFLLLESLQLAEERHDNERNKLESSFLMMVLRHVSCRKEQHQHWQHLNQRMALTQDALTQDVPMPMLLCDASG